MQKPVPHTMLEFICDENIVGHSLRCIFSRMISINHRNRKGTFYDVQYIFFVLILTEQQETYLL